MLRQRAEADLATLQRQKAEVQAQLEQVTARIQSGSPAAPARQAVAATQAQVCGPDDCEAHGGPADAGHCGTGLQLCAG